jgi:hypothetical protein
MILISATLERATCAASFRPERRSRRHERRRRALHAQLAKGP